MAPTLPARWFLFGFLIVMALVALFSYTTFSRVRHNALIADANVHIVTWGLLVYADRHGAFPEDGATLIAEPWAPELERLVGGAGGDAATWPLRFDDANAGPAPARPGTWSGQMRDALRTTRIRRPIDGVGPPLIDTPGSGTLHGSVARANAWLAAAYEALPDRVEESGRE